MRRYGSAAVISAFGDGFSYLAVPLIAAGQLGAGPRELGWLTALAWLPQAVFSLPAGSWVARRGRPIATLVVADLARAALMILVAIAAVTGSLTLTILYLATFCSATAAVFFSVSDAAVLPALAKNDRFARSLAIMQANRTVGGAVGTTLGGLVIRYASAPLAVLIDAVSFVVSATALRGVHLPSATARTSTSSLRLSEGLRCLWRTRPLRTALAVTTTSNFFHLGFHALIVLYATQILGLSAGTLGLVISTDTIGVLAASALAPALLERFGNRVGLAAGNIIFACPLLLVAAATGPVMVAAGILLSGFGGCLQDISVGSTFAVSVPPRLRSAVRGAYQSISFGVRPLGALAAGLAGTWVGLRPAVWATVIGGILAVLWMVIPAPAATVRAGGETSDASAS